MGRPTHIPISYLFSDDCDLPDHLQIPTELDATKAIKKTEASTVVEYMRKDQGYVFHKVIPKTVEEIDVFFCDDKNRKVCESLGTKEVTPKVPLLIAHFLDIQGIYGRYCRALSRMAVQREALKL